MTTLRHVIAAYWQTLQTFGFECSRRHQGKWVHPKAKQALGQYKLSVKQRLWNNGKGSWRMLHEVSAVTIFAVHSVPHK
jgi:hypothetical protein